MLKKLVSLALCIMMFCALLSGCGLDTKTSGAKSVSFAPDYGIQAAVVYSGGNDWMDTLLYLEQSPMLGLHVTGLLVENADFSPFDILYLDDSLLNSAPANFADMIEAYTRAGGAVFLPFGFAQYFSKEFLGISEVKKIEGCLSDPSYPKCNGDESMARAKVCI